MIVELTEKQINTIIEISEYYMIGEYKVISEIQEQLKQAIEDQEANSVE
jgi:hypothetical protein